MKDNDKRFFDYWGQKRTQGAIKFSIVTGIVYGVFVIVFSKLFAWNWHFTQKDLTYGILSILIGVTLLGPFLWWHRERKYHKLLELRQQERKNKKKKKSR